ncbi:hypothetical protein BpHYR1_033169 [Brachionus plicatilis]|uniref:Uncharacterized protein n=1 Tax=Brachionus plicatilis TaxID=10195 RepID=A0A3M7QLL8_BRAPC|nr:hypothetical protein BpHYR1_033169 [Brachionus plicatilis]
MHKLMTIFFAKNYKQNLSIYVWKEFQNKLLFFPHNVSPNLKDTSSTLRNGMFVIRNDTYSTNTSLESYERSIACFWPNLLISSKLASCLKITSDEGMRAKIKHNINN